MIYSERLEARNPTLPLLRTAGRTALKGANAGLGAAARGGLRAPSIARLAAKPVAMAKTGITTSQMTTGMVFGKIGTTLGAKVSNSHKYPGLELTSIYIIIYV